ncbi:putative tRNA-dihydrouridine synthase [candidate division SR1 bacterium Aalborg_AAW-1]|nr:putative tRNA-dihydrouridine synthase [candidate division SR1 bacterium Aalborg_AAW-1]
MIVYKQQIIILIFLVNFTTTMILGLAPMDGVTDYSYRRIVQEIFNRYGEKEKHNLWKRTEFMSADGYMINPSRLVKHLITCEDESNLIAQIYGGNIDTLLKTAQDIEQKYPFFQGIELNIGCPSPKILACGAGAGMMRNKHKTLEYIRTLSEGLSLPFSIKTRAGLNNDDKDEQFKFILEAAKYCPTITIHGRTYSQAHNGEVDRDFIYRIKQELGDAITIIGNGGINAYEDYQIHEGKVDGIMIGQSAMQNPRIFTPYTPTEQERIDLSLRHLLLMGAYEIYMNHTRAQYPEESDQLMLNRQNLHLNKKYDPDSDEIKELPPIDFHDYIFPFPSYDQIEKLAHIIQNTIEQESNSLTWNYTIFHLNELRCGIEFRKYLFGYIKGLSYTKELKQKIIATSKFSELYKHITHYKN